MLLFFDYLIALVSALVTLRNTLFIIIATFVPVKFYEAVRDAALLFNIRVSKIFLVVLKALVYTDLRAVFILFLFIPAIDQVGINTRIISSELCNKVLPSSRLAINFLLLK
jgi:hypothetical protein